MKIYFNKELESEISFEINSFTESVVDAVLTINDYYEIETFPKEALSELENNRSFKTVSIFDDGQYIPLVRDYNYVSRIQTSYSSTYKKYGVNIFIVNTSEDNNEN